MSSNERGQGLIEYLIIVALMGIATIAIIRTMGEAVSSRFAIITYALKGEKKSVSVRVDESSYKKRDLSDFFNGTSNRSPSKSEENQ